MSSARALQTAPYRAHEARQALLGNAQSLFRRIPLPLVQCATTLWKTGVHYAPRSGLNQHLRENGCNGRMPTWKYNFLSGADWGSAQEYALAIFLPSRSRLYPSRFFVPTPSNRCGCCLQPGGSWWRLPIKTLLETHMMRFPACVQYSTMIWPRSLE